MAALFDLRDALRGLRRDRGYTLTVVLTLAPNSNIEFHLDGAVISTLTIPAGQYISPFFYVKAKAAGTGTVTISAPNYTPVSRSLTVAP